MRSLEVVLTCDVCEIRTFAVTSLIFGTEYDVPPDRVVDLCATHCTTLTLVDLVANSREYTPMSDKPQRKSHMGHLLPAGAGTPPPRSRGKDRKPLEQLSCPDCPKTLAGYAAMSMHMKAFHPENWVPRSKRVRARMSA